MLLSHNSSFAFEAVRVIGDVYFPLFPLTLSFPGSPAGLPGPHTKSSRRSSCYNREVGVWVRLKAISVVLSLILASLGRFPRNFLPFSDSYTFLVYHQDI